MTMFFNWLNHMLSPSQITTHLVYIFMKFMQASGKTLVTGIGYKPGAGQERRNTKCSNHKNDKWRDRHGIAQTMAVGKRRKYMTETFYTIDTRPVPHRTGGKIHGMFFRPRCSGWSTFTPVGLTARPYHDMFDPLACSAWQWQMSVHATHS